MPAPTRQAMATIHSARNGSFIGLLLTPVLASMLVLFVIPIVWNLWISLHDVSFVTFRDEWNFVGFGNYAALAADRVFPKIFHKSMLVTLTFTVASVLGQFVAGFGLALLLQRLTRYAQLFRAIIVLPWVLSELVVAYIWLFTYQQHGPLNNALAMLGIDPVPWLSSSSLAIWSVSLTNIWFGTPFTLLMMGAALTTINPETIEAARMDGARPRQILTRITIPLLKPFIALNLVLITMWTVNIFALPLAMTQGGPAQSTTTASLLMYRQAFEFGNFSIGSSIGIMLFLLNIVGAVVYVRTQRSSHV
jgi:multiple sugar transport system permease protein